MTGRKLVCVSSDILSRIKKHGLIPPVYRIEEYIPDALYEQYENMRDLAIDWLIRIGLIGKGDKAATKSKSSNDSPRKSTLLQLLFDRCQG